MNPALLSPADLAGPVASLQRIAAELDRLLLGRPELHRQVLVGVLARGHLLLEGVPGVGKTALIKALAGLLGLGFGRVQFTPDLMPGDILGSHVLEGAENGRRELVFHPGPVFTNLLLADEINRASPKTQSALLEAMEERAVTLLGTTRPLPQPFFVLASQNPIELEGTYPLPEAQLDRFLMKLVVGVPSPEVLADIVSSRRRGDVPAPQLQLRPDDLTGLFAAMERVVLPRGVASWIGRLVAATHPESREAPEIVKRYVRFGASPRAAIALGEAARAEALLAGRPTVGFEDVRRLALPVLRHRLLLAYPARVDGVSAEAVARGVLAAVDPAPLGLPADVEVGAS
jgi:MoxR-like ATPase